MVALGDLFTPSSCSGFVWQGQSFFIVYLTPIEKQFSLYTVDMYPWKLLRPAIVSGMQFPDLLRAFGAGVT